MPRLVAFNNVSLDGYFTDANGDLSWAHMAGDDAEFKTFVSGNARAGGMLVLGRVTYELMVGYWPTPLASHNDPLVAERMNTMPKLVFSRTLEQVSWSNTTLVSADIVAEIRRRKQEAGTDMTILGSGSIIAQLAQAGLIDEYQLVLHPVVLGQGRTMFDGMSERLNLRLTRTRPFASGKVVLSYEPIA